MTGLEIDDTIAFFTCPIELPFQLTTISFGLTGFVREPITDSLGLASGTAFQQCDPVNFGRNDGGDLLCEQLRCTGWCCEQHRSTKCVFAHMVVDIFQCAVVA